jgi:uncharacterized protein YbaR (Trm112 family)
MALSPELKEILACPRCKGDLEFREAEGEIRCHACRLVYRIEDDIPVMLVDEARPFGDAPADGSGPHGRAP